MFRDRLGFSAEIVEKTIINYIIDYNYNELNDISNNFFDNHKILNKKYNADFLHC